MKSKLYSSLTALIIFLVMIPSSFADSSDECDVCDDKDDNGNYKLSDYDECCFGFCCEQVCYPLNSEEPPCPNADPPYMSQFTLYKIKKQKHGYATDFPKYFVTELHTAHEYEYKLEKSVCKKTPPNCGANPEPKYVVINEPQHQFGLSVVISQTPISVSYSYSGGSVSSTFKVFPDDYVPYCVRTQGAWDFQLFRHRVIFKAISYTENYKRIENPDPVRRKTPFRKTVMVMDDPFITDFANSETIPKQTNWSKFKRSAVKVGGIVKTICE